LNNPPAICQPDIWAKIAEIVLERLGEKPDDEEGVALRDLFGASMIPADAAKLIKEAVQRMEGEGHVTRKDRWKALERLAAAYLGGTGHATAVGTAAG
jgi:hypothetical protein